MWVEPKLLHLNQPFTVRGGVIAQPVAAYEEYGRRDARAPVIVLTHGGLQDCHMAGRYGPKDAYPGTWDALVGPGRVFDTEKYRVVAVNALGSMFGSSSALSTNPVTGKPYGPDFPEFDFNDSTRFLYAVLQQLGVAQVALVAGPSMGGCHALNLAALYPRYVSAVAAVAAAGYMTPEGIAYHTWVDHFLTAIPCFNGGHYTAQEVRPWMHLLHQNSRIYWGHWRRVLNHSIKKSDPLRQKDRMAAAEKYLTEYLEEYLDCRDPNCYRQLLMALNTYNLGEEVGLQAGAQRITCPVLMLNFTTDSEFPPVLAHELVSALRPGQAVLVELDSPDGHYGCLLATAEMAPHLQAFLQRVL